MTLPSQELDATVEAVENNKVIIRILSVSAREAKPSRDGSASPRLGQGGPAQLIKVDRKFLTGEIRIGTPLKIEILTAKQAEKRRASLGKAVLEEILNGGK